ncbi:MAG: 3-phosphoshikimate 1-carboxyvinyltransferase [Chromatiales bacterium]|jgi:3-phosphoshikimate 1-carboxyvinyltransferase|nr:3-phosphoshikimate 1-carboxyvinyltransferase [Chromatiales bacterium]
MGEPTLLNYQVRPGSGLVGSLVVPGDKSISHRAVMLGALADGVSEISNFLEGEDTRATAAAFRAMGVDISGDGCGALTIKGRGLHGLIEPAHALDLGNSGTGMRLLTGVAAGQKFPVKMVGDKSLSARPMARIAVPLRSMGASVIASADDTPPLTVSRGNGLSGITYAMPMASAQVKSCLLLAGLYADGETRVREPGVCRDHTERMLESFGYRIERSNAEVALSGGGVLTAGRIEIPSDISSAAFFLVGASIAKGSDLLLRNIGMNPTRDGIIHILRAMGANIEVVAERLAGAEPLADLRVRSAPLQGIDVPGHLVANAIDEFPAVFVAAACARGTTRLRGAKELRVKETDRIEAMAEGLRALGVDVTTVDDGMDIVGGAIRGGAQVRSFGDHRIAMALTTAGLVAGAPITVIDCANVATSFPGFVVAAQSVGLPVSEA